MTLIMTVHSIEEILKKQVCEIIQLHPDAVVRYRVSVPFMFDDGDVFVIILKQEGERWVFSDEGHTYMHLSYSMDENVFQQGTRRRIITRTLTMFQVQDRDGELILPIEDAQYGETLWNFIQA